jgi:hypothetical protein
MLDVSLTHVRTSSPEESMTPDEFRSAALSFPETIESAHMNHPDFRVDGKIFATLEPDEGWGMANLNAEQQAWFLTTNPRHSSPQPVRGAFAERPSSRSLTPRNRR